MQLMAETNIVVDSLPDLMLPPKLTALKGCSPTISSINAPSLAPLISLALKPAYVPQRAPLSA